MRFTLIPVLTLAASFSLVAAQSASTGAAIAPFQIDLMQRPTPVYVLNFPEVQAVEGTVAVSNLPAVQTVGGTVNVTNLPLDADGAVRVTSAPARQMVWYELIDEPISFAGDLLLPSVVNTDGYSSVGVLVNDNADSRVDVFWQWASDEGFVPVADTRNGFQGVNELAYRCGGLANVRLVCANAGGNARVRLHFNSGVSTVTSVRVYLFP